MEERSRVRESERSRAASYSSAVADSAILGQAGKQSQPGRQSIGDVSAILAAAMMRLECGLMQRFVSSDFLTLDPRPSDSRPSPWPSNRKPRSAHAGRELSRVVSAGREGGRPGRELRRPRLHGHQAVGLCDLGEHPAAARRDVQGHRPRERVLPAVHSDELPGEGGAARRRVRQGVRGRDAPSARAGWQRRPAAGARSPSWKSR